MAYEEVTREFVPMWAGCLNESVEGFIREIGKGKFGAFYNLELMKPTKITIKGKDDSLLTEMEVGDKIILPAHADLMGKLTDSGAIVGNRYLISCVDERETDYTDDEGNPIVQKMYKVLKWTDKKK